jgi:MFS family permease
VAYAEASQGIGLTLGPVLSSLVYSHTNFMYTFLIFGVGIMIGGLVILTVLPEKYNMKRQETPMDSMISELMPGKLSYSDFLLNKRCAFTLGATMCVIVITSFLEAILSLRLSEFYDIGGDKAGYVYGGAFLAFTLACPFVNKICQKYKQRRIMISLSFLIMACGLVLTGPSKFFNLPK